MIITVIFLVIAVAAAIYFYTQNAKNSTSLYEKEGIIEALQMHSRNADAALEVKQNEIKKLKSEIQSLNDKAKASVKPAKASGISVDAVKASGVSVDAIKPAKAKRSYKKKTA